MKIDAHQHFWQYHPVRHAWIDDSMEKLRRDFLPNDLAPLLEKTGFDGCVAVQADQSEEETLFLLDLAEEHDFIKSVVGWVDLKSPDLEERLEYFSQYPKLKGFRHILQAEPEGFMADTRFVQGIEKLHEYRFSYDLLIYETQLSECIELISRLPEMKLVIDHIAKPRIKDGSFKNWSAQMRKISTFPNVYVKLSGLVTEADWQQWTTENFKPYIESCLEYFGANRLMIGSDWPVCLLAANYKEVIGIVEHFTSGLSQKQYDAIMGNTAQHFYQIDE